MNRHAIASLGVGSHERMLRLARRSFEPYARRHGYDLHLYSQPLDTSRPISWSKIRILRDLIERYESVLWLDADVVIVDVRRDIGRDMEAGHFLYLVEHRYGDNQVPNAGVMLIRSGEEAADFLDQVWDMKHHVDHGWWEQAAVCELLGYDLGPPTRPGEATTFRRHTKFISPRWNSTYFSPARRPRIRHFAMFSGPIRVSLMVGASAEAAARRAAGR